MYSVPALLRQIISGFQLCVLTFERMTILYGFFIIRISQCFDCIEGLPCAVQQIHYWEMPAKTLLPIANEVDNAEALIDRVLFADFIFSLVPFTLSFCFSVGLLSLASVDR